MSTKKRPFIFSSDFDKGAQASEEERIERINNPNSKELSKSLEEKAANVDFEGQKKDKKEGPKKFKRFQNSIEGVVPALFIKKNEFGTVHVYNRILEEYKIHSIKIKMSVQDLINIAAYEYLKKEGIIKE